MFISPRSRQRAPQFPRERKKCIRAQVRTETESAEETSVLQYILCALSHSPLTFLTLSETVFPITEEDPLLPQTAQSGQPGLLTPPLHTSAGAHLGSLTIIFLCGQDVLFIHRVNTEKKKYVRNGNRTVNYQVFVVMLLHDHDCR